METGTASDKSYIDDLINEVEKRPVIWTKKAKVYKRKLVLIKEWQDIAKKFNKTPEEVKKKWRCLRELFYAEERKFNLQLQEAEEGIPLSSCYKGKWPYFNRLFFLYRHKDKVNRGTSTSTDHVNENDTRLGSGDVKVELDLFEHTDDFDERYFKTTSDTKKESEESNESPKTKDASENNEFLTGNYRSEATDTNVIDTSVLNEEQNRDQIPLFITKPLTTDSNNFDDHAEYTDTDPDVIFVKSLMPYFKRLNPIRKLIVKNEMQNLVIKEMVCKKCRITGPKQDCRCNLFSL